MIRHYQEVYDLNTTIGAMTILALHTPQAPSLKKMFKGHFINYKKYKVLGCSFRIACASQLPLSAEEVGFESGLVDPRDIMNPMLFKACTGDNLNALLNQIYNKTEERQDQFGEADGSVGEHKITETLSRRAYYQLLSDPTWRKAHPQAGMVVRNLKPMVHKVVTTQPFKWNGLKSSTVEKGISDQPFMPGSASGGVAANQVGFGAPSGKELTGTQFDAQNPNVFVSNGVTPMPWLDTAVPQSVTTLGEKQGDNYALASQQANYLINNIPRVYMGALIMPPAVSTKFYMRMVIDWKIAFKDWRPAYEIGNMGQMQIIDTDNSFVSQSADVGWTTYFNYYHDISNSKLMADNDDTCKDESSFTTNGLDSSEMVFAS